MLLAELSPIEEITELQVAPRAESINRFLDEVHLNGRPIVLQSRFQRGARKQFFLSHRRQQHQPIGLGVRRGREQHALNQG
jgi:hypothetical protein